MSDDENRGDATPVDPSNAGQPVMPQQPDPTVTPEAKGAASDPSDAGQDSSPSTTKRLETPISTGDRDTTSPIEKGAPDANGPIQADSPNRKGSLLMGAACAAVAVVVCVVIFSAFGAGRGKDAGEVPSSAPAAAQSASSSPAASSAAASSSGAGTGAAATTEDDGVIHAQGVDTSSKFSFTVETAVAGLDQYTNEPVVALLGTFTNNSDKPMDFGSTLKGVATQAGVQLSDYYLSGEGDLNYQTVQPGQSATVAAAWSLSNTTDSVHISVTDLTHYAKQEVYSHDFTIDELVANMADVHDQLNGSMESDPSLGA